MWEEKIMGRPPITSSTDWGIGEAFSVDQDTATSERTALGRGESERAPWKTPTEPCFEGIVGQSKAIREVLEHVKRVATSDSTVLLLGETGTGKELIARALHDRGRRKNGPLVKFNCAAIPSGLLESEMFGHERGAFTGAINQKLGRLELAHQGTLFLDEVGDLPLELQPKLLRILQEHEFERLGSTRTMKVDIRLVAATHRDLETMMGENQFRSDLYYRLNVFAIRIPPLRERPEDIPVLVRYFTDKYARRMGKRIDTIPPGALRKLMRWHWPGNVRELENIVERAVILTRSTTLAISLPESTNGGGSAARAKDNFDEQERMVRILRSLVERSAMLTPENSLPVSGPESANNAPALRRQTRATWMSNRPLCASSQKPTGGWGARTAPQPVWV
jgi:formate hydrogenlyase transcriptional activator